VIGTRFHSAPVIRLAIGNAQAWRDTFREQIPDLPIRIWPDAGDVKDIEYLAFMHPDFNLLPAFPNLKAMFSRAAGVDDIVQHPKLPKVPLGKIEPPGGDPMMTEYVVMHVLRLHRDMPAYQAAQARREWLQGADCPARAKARRLSRLRNDGQGAGADPEVAGLPVSAWVRSPRQAAEVPIFHGGDQLEAFLRSDRYRGLPVAADAGNRRHLLRALVPVSSRVTALPHPAYQRGGLPRLSREISF
jgi:glyoxylate/hydroxypyruvate reductase A